MTVRRLLVLDGSLAGDAAYGLAACVTREEQKKADLFSVDLFSVQAVCQQSGRQAAEGIGLLLAQALEESGWGTENVPKNMPKNIPECVAVVIGPGSFTGLRASCATAAGYALGVNAALVGVTRGEALAPALEEAVAAQKAQQEAEWGWRLITTARKGRVFIEEPDTIQAFDITQANVQHVRKTQDKKRWVLAGDAAPYFACENAVLLPLYQPTPEQIAAAALRRLRGDLPPRAALPLYVDPPEARLPAEGLRPAPFL